MYCCFAINCRQKNYHIVSRCTSVHDYCIIIFNLIQNDYIFKRVFYRLSRLFLSAHILSECVVRLCMYVYTLL